MNVKAYLAFLFSMIFFACENNTKDVDNADNAWKLNSYGLELAQQGKYRESIGPYFLASTSKAISDSMRTVYLGNLAVAYHELELEDSAKYYFTRAASLNPKNSYYYLENSAYIFLVDNELDSTVRLLESAYKIDSTKPTVNNLLGVLYLGDYAQYLFDPEKALQYNINAHRIFDNIDTKFVLAKNYYHLNRTKEALDLFREICRELPDRVDYLVTLIMVEQEMNNKLEVSLLLQKLKVKDVEKHDQLVNNPVLPGTHVINWSH